MNNSLGILDEAVHYFIEKKVIFFLGAGISRIAGCRDWKAIIVDLLNDDCIPSQINKDDFINSKQKNNLKIEFLKKNYFEAKKEKEFWGVLRKATTFEPDRFYNDYLPLIRSFKLIDPFPIIVTTNVDTCLEDSGEFNHDLIYYEIDDFKISNLREKSIFHIHGYRLKFIETLFTKEQYKKIYEDDRFREFISFIFSNYCIIFIGYSLNDEELLDVLYEARCESIKMPNYILIPTNEVTITDISIYEATYKIKLIEYGPIEEFPEIIKSWINKNFISISIKEKA